MDSLYHVHLGDNFVLQFDERGVDIIHSSQRKFRIDSLIVTSGPAFFRGYTELWHAMRNEKDPNVIPAELRPYIVE